MGKQRLGKRERKEARKAFIERRGVVMSNLSSPIVHQPSRGLSPSWAVGHSPSSKAILGSSSPRFHDTRIKGSPDSSRKARDKQDRLDDLMRHRFNVVDQWGQSWGGCDREKEAYRMCNDLQKHPDMANLKLRVEQRL